MELAKLTNFDEELEPGEEDDGYYLDFDGGQGGDHHAGDFLKELYGHSLIAPRPLLLLAQSTSVNRSIHSILW